MMGYLHKGASTYTLLSVAISYLICQSGVTGWVCHMVRTVFSAVEHLTLEHDSDGDSNWSYIADRILWHEILKLFGSVKTFRVGGQLVGQLSRVLQPGEVGLPAELLPELQELSYPATPSFHNAFTPFIDGRQKAGRPVTVVHP